MNRSPLSRFRLSPPPRLAQALVASGILFAATPSLSRADDSVNGATASDASLPAIRVSAQRDSDLAAGKKLNGGALGDRAQVDTPFSTTVKTGDDIADLGARSATDAFKYDAATATATSGETSENATFSIRGMEIDQLNSTKVDGQSFPQWDIDLGLEPFEQVQLLKGLSGFMYGFGAPGGIVNYVLKRPTDEPHHGVSVGYRSAGVFNASLDMGGRVGADQRLGYRFNIADEQGTTAESNGHIRRKSLSLALDYRITPDLTWTFDAMYQERKQTGTLFGIFLYPDVDVPDAGKVSRSLAQPQTFYASSLFSVGTGLEYKFSPTWQASVKYRYAKENRYNADSLLFVSNNAGDYSNTVYAAKSRYDYQNVDAMVQGSFDTGPLKHAVVFGASDMTQSTHLDNSIGWNEGFDLGSGNLYDTTLLTNAEVSIGENLYRKSWLSQAALYASDTVRINSRLSVLAGVRYTRFRQDSYDTTGANAASYKANPVSPTVAVMFKTDPYSTLYASYVQSLEQGGSAGSTNANYPATFGPLKSRQYEIGFKTDRARWGANVALFRVDRGYDYTNTENVYVQDGTRRYTGLDAGGWVLLGGDWKLMGGLLALDSKAVDIDDSSVEGKRIYGAPRFVATGRVEYNPAFLRKLTVAAGAKYTSNMAVEAANTHIVPSYTTVDLSAKYDTRLYGKDVTFRAGINNLLNRRYWTAAYGYYILPGATRTLVTSATFQF
ncbi:MAG: TonB-dependent siderophore receptor [Janthinobacterium lividum]